MPNVTKTIRTEAGHAKNTDEFARSLGSSYSAFHSKIDSLMQDKELAEQIYKIIKQANRKRQIIKLSEEEKAFYADNDSQPRTILRLNPRELEDKSQYSEDSGAN